MWRFVRRAGAAVLIVPVCVDHRPHLEVAPFAGEPVPTMPFNAISKVTANIVLPSFGGNFIVCQPKK